MREIMVFFQQEGQRERRELLFPAERPVGDLLSLLIDGLRCRKEDPQGERIEYTLRVYPAAQGPPDEVGLELSCDQTLSQAGVLDRSLLILCRRPEERRISKPPEKIKEDIKGQEGTKEGVPDSPEVERWPYGETKMWQPTFPTVKPTEEGECLPLEEWLKRVVPG